jgi:capsular polysaccharide biosynthesis protein
MLRLDGLDHVFSVEMKSKRYVKNISISDEAHDRVLFEGSLGKLRNISLVEGDVLEIIGVNGVLRITLTKEQLQETIKTASQVEP